MHRLRMSSILSLQGEVVLKIKLSILILLSLFFLPSCTGGMKAALVTEDEAVIYLGNGRKVVSIEVDEHTMEYLSEIGKDEPKDVLSSLFSLDAVYVDKNDYLRRDEIFSLLLRVTGEESVLAALNKYGKDLRKTDFINTINELSTSFDDERLLDETISAERVYEYSLGPVLSYNIKAYDEVEAFIAIWVEELMR